VDEWRIHNAAYNLGFKIDHSADCDFDNKDEGKNLVDFIWGK
jgi:hypothetical protein